MTRRHPIRGVVAYLPYAEVVVESTVTLGANQALSTHFSAAQLDEAEIAYIEPHAADAWVKFGGGTPATDDGHQIAAHEVREITGNSIINDMHITGSGVATITLWKYSGS